MRFAAFALLLTLAPPASAQHFVRKWHSFFDSTNGSYIHYVDPPGAVLLDGYLRGNLKGYSFDIKSEGLKFKPLPAEWRPPKWNPAESYFPEDRVEFGGKFYMSVNEPRPGTKPAASEYWHLINLTGPAVSTRHSFPGPNDILQVADFLSTIILYDFRCPDAWLPDYDYYNEDEVIFKSRVYSILRENRDRQPDISPDDWVAIEPQVTFATPCEFSRVVEIYWQDADEQALPVPQMISPAYFDNNRGWWQLPTVHFYYQEAIDYVATQRRMPLLYASTIGYVGTPQLILGTNELTPMMELLLGSLHSGAIKSAKADIADQRLYDSLQLSAKKKISALNWHVMQDMRTNDVLIFHREQSFNKLAMKVPWTTMENIIKEKTPAPRILGYQEALKLDVIASDLDTLESVDTLTVLPYQSASIPHPASMYFIEERHASLFGNAGLEVALTELWSRLTRAANNKEIVEQSPSVSLFPGNQPLPEMTFCSGGSGWKLNKGHTLEFPFDSHDIDLEAEKLPAIGFAVQYKRTLDNGKALFEPLKFAVELRVDEEYTQYYYFGWTDVMKVSANDFKIALLIHRVTTGQLEFDQAEVVYGLVGER